MDEFIDEISESNYYAEKIIEIDDEIERIDERIQNAFSQDVINDLKMEKEQLLIEREEWEDKRREIRRGL
ncbi:hypothetical protein Mpsy_2292 [Methanolobus psychrophilus R15]|nr:hypothetical protein Mpsy_2292 [Methanolobus psychrophilus R15]